MTRSTRQRPLNDAAAGQVKRPGHVPAVARACDILELVLDAHGPVTATDVAGELGLPRTTVHELLTTLVARSYLTVVDGAQRRFDLGPALLRLGYGYQSRIDLGHEGHEAARRVAEQCQETVHVATLDGVNVLYVAKIDSTRGVRTVSAVGRRLPAHLTAVGKMLLASCTDEKLDALFPLGTPLPARTENSITDPAHLRRVLREVRAEGLAHVDREVDPEVGCVAAPVRDHTGAVVAAMSISVPVSRRTAELEKQWEQQVRAGAQDLSHRLGFAG